MDRALTDMNFLDRMQSLMRPENMSQDEILSKLVPSARRGRHKIKWGEDRKGKQRYKEVEGVSISSGTIRLASELSKTKDVYDKAVEGTDIQELVKLKTEAKDLKVHQSIIEKEIDSSIRLAQEVKEQETLRVEEEAKDFLLSEYKKAETVEEEEKIRRELKAELPYSLRSLKGWRTRKGALAFKYVFKE